MRFVITCFPQTWKLLIKPKIVYLILNLPWSWDSYNFFPLDISYIKWIFEPIPLRKYVNPLNSKIVVATDHRATKWKQMAIKKKLSVIGMHLMVIFPVWIWNFLKSASIPYLQNIWFLSLRLFRFLGIFAINSIVCLCWKVSELCCLLPFYLYTAH